MRKVHVSAVTAAILASAVMVSQVNATDIVSPANVIGSPAAVQLSNDTTTYWDMAGGATNFRIGDVVNNTAAIQVYASSNNLNSLVVDSSGSVKLANDLLVADKGSSSVDIAGAVDAEAVTVTADPKPIGPTRTAYPALNMAAAGDSSIAWTLATGTDTESPGQNAVGFINANTGDGPFFIVNDAVSDLLLLSEDTVAVNSANLDDELFGTANLIVGGNILSTWEGSNTEDDGLTNLLVLSANNSELDKESDAGFGLKNAREDIQWNFRTHQGGTAFVATLAGTGGPEFTVKNATSNVSGTELYLGNGAKNVGGVWINASSRALKENIKDLSTQDALAAFHKLQPVTYNYKSDKKEQVVGFIAEDVPKLVSINSRDGLSSMDMVAVLTKVAQEQDKTLTETKAELEKAQEKIAKLETMQKRLAKVESLLTNLALDTSNSKTEKVSLNNK